MGLCSKRKNYGDQNIIEDSSIKESFIKEPKKPDEESLMEEPRNGNRNS